MEIRDLETLGPLVASSLRSDATAQGPRVSKSRISMDSPYNLYFMWVLLNKSMLLKAMHKRFNEELELLFQPAGQTCQESFVIAIGGC